MRRLIVSAAVLTVCVQLGVPVLEACGAKFLAVTGSARLQRARHTTRPAAILLYQHDSDAGLVEFLAKLQKLLTEVGHSVTLVTSEAALRDAAANGEYNLVMIQLDAARRLRSDLQSRSPRAAILPMQAFLTRSQAARMKQEFGHVLQLPTTDRQLFSVVEATSR
jgi:CheY-like chemotaxis protein